MLAELEPYIDGYIDPIGQEITVIPRPKFPFDQNPIRPDTYSREYERDYDIFPGSPPRADVRTAWTNLLTYSEDIDNAAWTKTNLSVTANSVTAPDGHATPSMDKLLETTTNAEHSAAHAVTVTAAAHEVSFFIKGGLTRTFVRGAFTDSAATVFSAFFSSSGYVISPSAGTTAKIVSLGNGHYHCVLRFTPASGAGSFKVNTSTDGSTISFAGSTAAGIYLWGAQVALGSVVPYISTLSTQRSILAPDRDPRDPMAYLIEETDPENISSHRQKVTRTFARIPLQQIIPASKYVEKPELPGTFPQVSGSALIVQPDPNVPRWIFYSQKVVTSDSGAPSPNDPTGGSYTLTVGANTTAPVAFNANSTAVAAAINGLASVSARGVVAVSGSLTSNFTLITNAYTPGSINSSSLTGTGGFVAGTTGVTMANPTRMRFEIVAVNVGSTFTGGTFTITMFGQTTSALAITATEADVKAAVEALSNVGAGNATVSRATGIHAYTGSTIMTLAANRILFSVTVAWPAFSVTGTSLTPAGSGATLTAQGTSPESYSLAFTGVAVAVRVLYSAGHGITAADGIIVTQGSNYRTISAGLYTVSADEIFLTATSGVAFAIATLITVVGKANGNVYTAKGKEVPIRRVTNYYLIDVSSGIATDQDIPLAQYEGDDGSMLEAIFSGDTELNIEVGELGPYRNGPNLQITHVTVNPQQL